MSRCPTFTFQLSRMSKWLAKHISTKDSFKIAIRKRHVYIDIGWPWMGNQCFYFGIWNELTKIIVFPSFELTTSLNSQNTIKLCLLMNPDTLICLWILVYPIGIIEVSTSRKCCFWLYFSSLHDYWPPCTWNLLVHTSWGKMVDVKNGIFSSWKCEKRKSAET